MAVEEDTVIAEYDVHLCNGLAGTKAQASVLYFCRQVCNSQSACTDDNRSPCHRHFSFSTRSGHRGGHMT